MTTRVSIFIVALLIGWSSPADAQTVRLGPKAIVVGPELYVGDVARIEGVHRSEAEQLAQTLLTSDLKSKTTITAEAVMFALITNSGRTDLASKLLVAGSSTCEVSLEEPETDTPSLKNGAGLISVKSNSLAANRQLTVANIAETTEGRGENSISQNDNNDSSDEKTIVRLANIDGSLSPPSSAMTEIRGTEKLSSLLVRTVLENLNVSADQVKVTYDTVTPLLDQPIRAGTQWQVRSLTRVLLGTVQWEAQLMAENKVLNKIRIQGRVLQKVQVYISPVSIKKGTILFDADIFKKEERWIDRVMKTYVRDPEEFIGYEINYPISAGDALDIRSFKQNAIVNRNDKVTVWFIRGGLMIDGQATAMAYGKYHDSILCRSDADESQFEARVIGRRMVVVGETSAEQEETLRSKK